MLSRSPKAALLLALCLGGAGVTHAAPAAAQSQEDLDRARSSFRQGLSLEAAGNWAAALAKFQEVARVKVTPQVRFHTARCYEQLGRLNESLGDYRLAEYEAGQQGLPDLAAITQARQTLEARIPKLVIRRGKGVDAARIELDGVELGEAQIGQALSVDPGPHTIVAKISPDNQFQKAATAREGATEEVVLDAPEAGAPADASPKEPSAGADAKVDTGTAAPSRSALPFIVGGVGVAGLIGAGAFYFLRSGAESDLEDTCRGNVCPKSVQGTQDKGELYATLSLVSLGVGVVGLGVGTYLFVSESGRSGAQASRRPFVPVEVAVLPRGGGQVTVRGAF